MLAGMPEGGELKVELRGVPWNYCGSVPEHSAMKGVL